MSKKERVSVFVPRGERNEPPNVVVAVNGVTYVLPKGKTSKVPPEVAAEYNRAERAKDKRDARADQMEADSNKE